MEKRRTFSIFSILWDFRIITRIPIWIISLIILVMNLSFYSSHLHYIWISRKYIFSFWNFMYNYIYTGKSSLELSFNPMRFTGYIYDHAHSFFENRFQPNVLYWYVKISNYFNFNVNFVNFRMYLWDLIGRNNFR